MLFSLLLKYFDYFSIGILMMFFDQGIYESKVPLEFKSILQIGCVCKVDKTAKKRNIQDGWSLDELQMKTTTECNYLEKPISFFFVYHR